MKKHFFLAFSLLCTVGLTVEAQTVKDFVGQWEFNCPDAPEEFSTGDLIVSKKENTIDVKVVYTNGTMAKGESAKIKDEKLEYFMYSADGGEITISLKIENDKINGTALLSSGEMLKITASRKAQ